MTICEYHLTDNTPGITKRRIDQPFKDSEIYYYKVNEFGVYYDRDTFGHVEMKNGCIRDRINEKWIRFCSPIRVIARFSVDRDDESRIISCLKEDDTLIHLKITRDVLKEDNEDLFETLSSFGISLKDVPEAKRHLVRYIWGAVGAPEVYGL